MTNEIELLWFALEIAVIFITNNRFFKGKKNVQRNSLPAQWETSQKSGSESSTYRTSYFLVWNFSQSDEPTVYGQLSSLLFPCRNSSQFPRRRTDGVRNCQCSVQLWVLKEDSKSEEWWATGFITLCKTNWKHFTRKQLASTLKHHSLALHCYYYVILQSL